MKVGYRVLVSVAAIPLLVACGAASASPTVSKGAVRIRPIDQTQHPERPTESTRVVFLDPGHGGKDWGGKARQPDGTWVAEKTFTLDIALRTASLLRASGYHVVLARTDEAPADQWQVNHPPRDLNGDGDIDGIDDVQARIDLANAAHADLLLSIHLNGRELPNGEIDPSFSGVVTLFDPDRPFAAENRRFAGLVQHEVLAAMAAALGRAPRDWGIADDTTLPTPFTTSHTNYHHEVELGPSEPNWIRASQMPGVISEPLFLSNPDELRALSQKGTRQSLAAGYVRAIEAFFRNEDAAQRHARG